MSLTAVPGVYGFTKLTVTALSMLNVLALAPAERRTVIWVLPRMIFRLPAIQITVLKVVARFTVKGKPIASLSVPVMLG
jgi:hypothetical protein